MVLDRLLHDEDAAVRALLYGAEVDVVAVREGPEVPVLLVPHARPLVDDFDRPQLLDRRVAVISSKMLGGASQIVSMIRVKCNGT